MSGGNRSTAHTALVRLCLDYMAAHRAWTFKVMGGMGQRAGVLDILSAWPPSGRLVAVEVKTGRAVLSDVQKREVANVQAVGAVALVVHTIEELEDALLAEGLIARRALSGRG